jgi:hypothetical protein
MSEFASHPSEGASNPPADWQVSDRTPSLQVTNTPPDLSVNNAPDKVHMPPPATRGSESKTTAEPVFVRERIDPVEHDVAEPKRYAYDFAPPPEGVEVKPQYRVIEHWNKDNVDPEKIVRAAEALSEGHKHTLPGETIKNPEELAEAERFSHALVALGDRVGVDIRDRIVPPSHLHIMGAQASFAKAYETSQKEVADPRTKGFFNVNVGAVVLRGAKPQDTYFIHGHEKLHGLMFKKVGLFGPRGSLDAPEDIDKRVFVGSSTFGRLKGRQFCLAFEEAVTDLITYQSTPATTDLTRNQVGYMRYDILLGGMIEAAGEFYGENPQRIEAEVIEGAFTGTVGSRSFHKPLGKAGVDRFEESVTHTTAECKIIAEDMRLPPGIRRGIHLKLNDYDKGNPVKPFEWQ